MEDKKTLTRSLPVASNLNGSCVDEDDTEYVYPTTRKRTLSHVVPNATQPKSKEAKTSNDKALYHVSVTTLTEENTVIDTKSRTMIVIDEVSRAKKWKWGVCINSVIMILGSLISIPFIVYYLFYQSPQIFISQAQIYRIPIHINDSYLGLQLAFDVINPNVVGFEVKTIRILPTIVSTRKGNPRYELEGTLMNITVPNVKARGFSNVIARHAWHLGSNTQYKWIENDILTNQFFLEFHGRVTFELSKISNTVRVQKTQFRAVTS